MFEQVADIRGNRFPPRPRLRKTKTRPGRPETGTVDYDFFNGFRRLNFSIPKPARAKPTIA
jgi:hypothetical protein